MNIHFTSKDIESVLESNIVNSPDDPDFQAILKAFRTKGLEAIRLGIEHLPYLYVPNFSKIEASSQERKQEIFIDGVPFNIRW
jgi:hypothetical protein